MKEIREKSSRSLESNNFDALVKLNTARVILEKLTNDYGFADETAPTFQGVHNWLTKTGNKSDQEVNSAKWVESYEYIFTMMDVVFGLVYDSHKLLDEGQRITIDAMISGNEPDCLQIEKVKEPA